jgi:V8-like Glu-specific endopeptidase
MLERLKQSKSVIAKEIRFTNKVIYGEDNRRDVAEESESRLKNWAKATLAQISPSKWSSDFLLDGETLGDSYSLCSTERFREQINPARCSGFLVAPSIVVTAGHCMQAESDCANFSWVSDFVNGVTTLKSEQIFNCKRIIKQELDISSGLDYAVIELDRELNDRKFFSMQQDSKVSSGVELVVIGHPSGLPTKIADGAAVRDNQEQHYFSANLDTYGGNSGSAVINKTTGKVEGILVRGDTDYKWSSEPSTGEACRVSNQCSDTGCQGEDVTRMSSVEDVPTILSTDKLRELLFTTQTAPTASVGWIADYSSYQFGGQVLGAVKFLEQCGIHHYESSNPETWESYYSGRCDQISKVEDVIESFGSTVYL